MVADSPPLLQASLTQDSNPPGPSLVLSRQPGEHWWGGAVADGLSMPFGARHHRRYLAVNAGFAHDPTSGPNQSAPLLLSDTGRYVWSDDPFEFTGPQYSTWMEMPYTPTQAAVLGHVRDLLKAGFPPGVVMIDDRWSVAYGDWRFDRTGFPDPGAMVPQLHEWGCSVMLWIVPFVSPDSGMFRHLGQQGLLVRDARGDIAIREWWNGRGALLDVTDPEAVHWLTGTLDGLMADFGIDGFKFDAGDLRHYRSGDLGVASTEPVDHCQAWAQIGLRYPINEYRACWKMGGQPLAQRLHDKPATWDSRGLRSLIPEGIAQGLIGHPFISPDMIGGGELGHAPHSGVDQELFVRYAQVAAFFPMMQFSLAPQRVLDPRHLNAVRHVVDLRQQLWPQMSEMIDDAATTGEPILRAVPYDFPGEPATGGEFTLGGQILVAPVLQQGAKSRTVAFPAGEWQAADGSHYYGGDVVHFPVDLQTLPWFRRIGHAAAPPRKLSA